MLKDSVTLVAIGTQINWPTDTTTVPDVVINEGRYSAVEVEGSTPASSSTLGFVDLTGYASATVYLITKVATAGGGAVQYSESPDNVNWTVPANFSSGSLTSTGTGTKSATLTNMRYVRFTMAKNAGGTDALTATVVVYAL